MLLRAFVLAQASICVSRGRSSMSNCWDSSRDPNPRAPIELHNLTSSGCKGKSSARTPLVEQPRVCSAERYAQALVGQSGCTSMHSRKNEAEPKVYAEAKVELGWTGELELNRRSRRSFACQLWSVRGTGERCCDVFAGYMGRRRREARCGDAE